MRTVTEPTVSLMERPSCRIRNFCIIAHIDHGKSTLADQLLLQTGAISPREFREQLLDDMDLERERGITIKASAVTFSYTRDGQTYEMNLIDTPGHVDFHYEVSRALAACEGAVLLVDATQGVQAQTVANAYAALEAGLHIIPVVNKIDLPQGRPQEVVAEMQQTLGIRPEEVLYTSGRTGQGVPELLQALVERIPPPQGSAEAPLRALVFDSQYDEFRGVVLHVRVKEGVIRTGQRIRLMQAQRTYEVLELGQLRPRRVPCPELRAGQVGYVVANIKAISDVHVGDTVTDAERPAAEPLPGYRRPKPMVFCGLYPAQHSDFESLRTALQRLALNDSSFVFEPETSDALGFGFRCGFLGMLHMEIVQQRLERESGLDLVQTAPNVTFELVTVRGETLLINNPAKMPDAGQVREIREPIVRVSFLIPADAIGPLTQLCVDRRGQLLRTEYLSPNRALLEWELPLAEVIYDLYDNLKSMTHGYGTMDYEFVGYRPSDLVRLDILVAGKRVDALSSIVHRSRAERRGRALVRKLKQEIDRHQFEVVLQAAIGSRVIARETIPALRKNVTAKCYGGDITRKRKLWAKQREGKKRLKQIGRVEIPQEAFFAVLRVDENG
jgi:GTP-binding protein LepA